MSQFNEIRDEYFKVTIFALALGASEEILEAGIKELEEENIFAGCRGCRDAISEWNYRKDTLYCTVKPSINDTY